jgi:hypothetical protein
LSGRSLGLVTAPTQPNLGDGEPTPVAEDELAGVYLRPLRSRRQADEREGSAYEATVRRERGDDRAAPGQALGRREGTAAARVGDRAERLRAAIRTDLATPAAGNPAVLVLTRGSVQECVAPVDNGNGGVSFIWGSMA